MIEVVSLLNKIPNTTREEKLMMYQGFCLLDESTTQDRAENITYYYNSKMRPFMAERMSSLFNEEPFLTGFDYYKELQMPTIHFAKTLMADKAYITQSAEALKE